MAALIAPTLSSSMPAGNTDAIIKPSVDMMPDASISADVPFKSINTEVSKSARMFLPFLIYMK
jgi:hypothetical protein